MNKSSYFKSEKTVVDSFQAFLVDGATFTTQEEYPIISSDMVPSSPPVKLMPFDKAIVYKGDLSDTFICFFTADSDFERIRKNPRKYIKFFRRTAGIIGFDYSIHSDMQIVKQKSQMNDNLSLTFYFGKNGIPVIPNLRCGIDELEDEFFSAIPQNKIVAIGTHGFIKTKHEQYEWYCFLERVIKRLHPSYVVVYGHLTSRIFDDLKSNTHFIFYEPWIYTNRLGGAM